MKDFINNYQFLAILPSLFKGDEVIILASNKINLMRVIEKQQHLNQNISTQFFSLLKKKGTSLNSYSPAVRDRIASF